MSMAWHNPEDAHRQELPMDASSARAANEVLLKDVEF